jgi:RNA polymerase sigma-70 factor (ECF subfamily)
VPAEAPFVGIGVKSRLNEVMEDRHSFLEARGAVMASDDDVANLMSRAKEGDEEAVRDFLSRFEWEVRMMVRARLPKRLRSQFDSIDFVQAVWQSFFSDLRQNGPDFERVEHVRRFLAGVVRNKVFEQHRKLTRTEKYDVSREERLYIRRGDHEVPREVISPDPSPSEAAQADDRLAQLTVRRIIESARERMEAGR